MTASADQRPAAAGEALVDVVVVSFNRRDLLLECCASVAATSVPTNLIVVDNASEDGSAAAVAAAFPDATVLRSDANRGFACAVNRGATAGDGPWILLLNSDACLGDQALERLLESIVGGARTAAIGPLIRGPDNEIELSVGRTMSPSSEVRFKLLERLYARGRGPAAAWVARRYGKRRSARSLSAACLLVRRDAFEAVGGMDERFFLYAEDVDLCRRLTAANWALVFEPAAEVRHVRGASTRAVPLLTEKAYRASQLAFYRKHHAAPIVAALRTYLCVKYAAAALVRTGEARTAARQILRTLTRGA